MEILQSHISLVTVFPQRAQVVRSAQIELPQGEHWLVFDNLPATIDPKSVQVNGVGKAIISKVQFQQVFPPAPTQDENQTLQNQKKAQEQQIRLLNEKIKRLHKQKEFLDDIAKKVTNPTQNSGSDDLKPATWVEMLAFYQKNLEEVDAQIFETEQAKRQEEELLTRTNWQLQQISSQAQQRKNQVLIGIETREVGTFGLGLSYIVHQANWQPVYDLRVSTETKQMQIHYKAIITQQTGEAWENTDLRLSTAQPAISGQQPEMNPWRIHLSSPQPRGMYGGAVVASAMPQQMFKADNLFRAADEQEEDDDEILEPNMEEATASVETKATSVFFNIVGKHSVKSDRTEHQVTILQTDFAAHFRYSAVPKLSQYAYLKIKVKNETDFPFLAGETNVFLDNNFVSHSSIGAVAPTEEFWTFLGIDESIKITYKFLKKYEKKEGSFFSKKVRVWLYEYLISVQNYKRTTEEIVIWDQLPISDNEQLKVHLLEPVFKENNDKLKKNELEYLEWFFQLKPQEEVKIPFKFSIEYPQDMLVSGV